MPFQNSSAELRGGLPGDVFRKRSFDRPPRSSAEALEKSSSKEVLRNASAAEVFRKRTSARPPRSSAGAPRSSAEVPRKSSFEIAPPQRSSEGALSEVLFRGSSAELRGGLLRRSFRRGISEYLRGGPADLRGGPADLRGAPRRTSRFP